MSEHSSVHMCALVCDDTLQYSFCANHGHDKLIYLQHF